LFYNVIFLSARWVLNRLLTSMIINDYWWICHGESGHEFSFVIRNLSL
jgi:hypothetical protein